MFSDPTERQLYDDPHHVRPKRQTLPLIEGQEYTPAHDLIKAETNQSVCTCESRSIRNNPFAYDTILSQPKTFKELSIGELDMVVARGPNNCDGKSGFYMGLISPDSIRDYPTEPLQYNPFIDTVAEYRSQLTLPSPASTSGGDKPKLIDKSTVDHEPEPKPIKPTIEQTQSMVDHEPEPKQVTPTIEQA